MTDPRQIEQVRRYLLGELPENEREAIAGRIFEDDGWHSLAREVENDLIDDFARGSLSRDEEARVRKFLSDTGQHDRLTVARAIAARARKSYSGPKVVLVFVSLAAILIAVLVTAFYMVRKPLILEQAKSKPVAPARAPVVFAFQLPPAVRGGTLPVIRIPSGTEFVEAVVELETGHDSYRLDLADQSGRGVAQGETRTPGSYRLRVPAAALNPGRYEIKVTASTGAGSPEPIAFHEFTIGN